MAKPKVVLRNPAGQGPLKRSQDPTRPWAQAIEAEALERNLDSWPDFMNDLNEKTITTEDFRKRTMLDAAAIREGKVHVRGRLAVVKRIVDGRMVESTKVSDGKYTLGVGTRESEVHGVKDGWYVEVKPIRTDEAFKKLVASNEWQTAKLLESFGGFDLGGGEWDGAGQAGPPNDEFIPLLGGPFSKNMYLYDFLEQQAKCFWIKNHHPLGRAAVKTLRNYTIGKGVDVLCSSPLCQKIWDDFVTRTKYNAQLRSQVTTLIWGGETMKQKTRDMNNRAKLKLIDSSTVWEVVTDPADIDNVLYYHQQFPTQWQLVYKQGDTSSEYIINDIPAEQVIHVRDNVEPGEKRGRSDLFPVLSWLKLYRDYRHAKVVKAQLEESYGLDIEVDGGPQDVQAIVQSNEAMRVPRAGSARVHNKAVVYKYLQPTASSTESKDDVGEALRKDIAIGAGIAPEWLGETGAGASKANSLTKEAPATRTIEDKQFFIEDMVRQDYAYVLQVDGTGLPEFQPRQADIGHLRRKMAARDWKGVLAEVVALLKGGQLQEPLDKSMEVIFPEISKEDRSAKIVDILKGQISDFISHRRAATMYAKEMAINNYDYDDEQEEISDEANNPMDSEWRQGAMAAVGKGAAPAGGGQAGMGSGGGAPAAGSAAGAGALRQQGGKS